MAAAGTGRAPAGRSHPLHTPGGRLNPGVRGDHARTACPPAVRSHQVRRTPRARLRVRGAGQLPGAAGAGGGCGPAVLGCAGPGMRRMSAGPPPPVDPRQGRPHPPPPPDLDPAGTGQGHPGPRRPAGHGHRVHGAARVPQLFVHRGGVPGGAVLQDADGGDVGQCLGGAAVGSGQFPPGSARNRFNAPTVRSRCSVTSGTSPLRMCRSVPQINGTRADDVRGVSG
jgi:hypothetical protein